MKKRAFDVETLDDYDIERIADKIEKTGRIATAVYAEVVDQVRPLRDLIEGEVNKSVRNALRAKATKFYDDEPYIKLLKYILEELTNENQS